MTEVLLGLFFSKFVPLIGIECQSTDTFCYCYCNNYFHE